LVDGSADANSATATSAGIADLEKRTGLFGIVGFLSNDGMVQKFS
jgi:hypothetical protein